jgi:hypothetical protein
MNNNKDYLIENITMIHGGAIPRVTTSASESVPNDYKEAIEKINKGERVCVILRGLPGGFCITVIVFNDVVLCCSWIFHKFLFKLLLMQKQQFFQFLF